MIATSLSESQVFQRKGAGQRLNATGTAQQCDVWLSHQNLSDPEGVVLAIHPVDC